MGLNYTCSLCGGSFVSDVSDADAVMEYQELFTPEMRAVGEKPPVVVCDVCHQRMMREMPPEEAFQPRPDEFAHLAVVVNHPDCDPDVRAICMRVLAQRWAHSNDFNAIQAEWEKLGKP